MLENFIYVLLIGLVAGFLAGQVMKGRGYGLLGNIIIGIIGAFLGSYLFGIFGLYAGSLLGQLVVAFIGAIVLIYLIRLVKRV